MDDLFGLGLIVFLVMFLGWCLGIAGWAKAGRAQAEIRRLKQALQAAGIVVDQANATGRWPEAARSAPAPTEAPVRDASFDEVEAPDLVAEPAAPAAPRRSLEELLTLRWGVWLGAAAVLLSGVFLIRYAVEEELLGPAARCLLAALLGCLLVGGAEWLRRRSGPASATGDTSLEAAAEGVARRRAAEVSAPALAAGGLAVLFGAVGGAGPLYDLVPAWLGFALLAAVAFAGMLLSLLQGPIVAAIGIVGAFVTPLLVEADHASPYGLYLYLLSVTAASLVVMRHTAWAWLGWAAVVAGAAWVALAALLSHDPAEFWAPALFVPAAAALHLFLLPGAALDGVTGRRLAWAPIAALAAAGLLLVAAADISWKTVPLDWRAVAPSLPPAAGLLLLLAVTLAKALREQRLVYLTWIGAASCLAMLLFWVLPPDPLAPYDAAGTFDAMFPPSWAQDALWPMVVFGVLTALPPALLGFWQEARAARPVRWAALPAAVPVLVLLVLHARLHRFAVAPEWASAALGIAAVLVAAAARAMRGSHSVGDPAAQRAGAHAAGAVAALALGAAMLLRDQWLTLAVSLFLPPLAWVERRSGLRALRQVALVVAAVVLVRLLLNGAVLDYAFGSAPVLNGLIPAYGVPALAFAVAAWMFRRQGDDLTVAVLEAGAMAFLASLVLLELRHFVTAGDLWIAEPGFRELSLYSSALLLLAAATLGVNRRANRPVLLWAWRVQGLLGIGLGVLLLVDNPGLSDEAVGAATGLNALLPAYLLPATVTTAFLTTREGSALGRARGLLAGFALLSAFAWCTLETRHAFHGDALGFDVEPILQPELWAWSGAWLALGAVLMAAGIRTRTAALRLTALAVIGLVVVKVFLVDMSELAGLWRVLSFLGLGLALIALGGIYQRFVVPQRTA